MRLGNYVEISTTVGDDEAAAAFYEKLGFQHAGYRVVTDGSINLNLAPPGVPAPLLRYAGSDLGAIAALDIGMHHDPRGLGAVTTPQGLHLLLSPHQSQVPMPAGTPASRCGMFGEYALPVADLAAALAYWEQLGFTRRHTAEEPYPWAILSDDLLVLGLHQTQDFTTPHLTYFAPDMPERIAAFQAEGLVVEPVSPTEDGPIANARLTGPGGEGIFLFHASMEA